jgi:HAMP domain-containing protein
LRGPARSSSRRSGARSRRHRQRYATTGSDGNAEYGDEAITRVINLAPRADDGALAVLQSQLPAALEPLRAMELRQALIILGGIVATVLVALMLARGITGPVRMIAAAARRVGAGDYSPIALDSRRDEVGELATSFCAMQAGVAANVSRMTEVAHRDALTGLPTRALFADRLDQAVAAGSRAGAPVRCWSSISTISGTSTKRSAIRSAT